ncbi:MAG: TIGR01212 family radical SAM protein [Firmicutes bacterium]|nr:TIGR01212 family radical SAM protein [Bacillota bacterium]
MFKYSLDNKRYHTLNYYYRHKFGRKTFKVPLDASFTCPNKATGGCIFCSNNSKSNITVETNDIVKQFNETKKILEKKWPNSLYIAYFQAGSNTYAPLNELKEKVEALLKLPNVVGISIATRPDCINDDCLEYLKELNQKTFLTMEIGLQTSNEKTLKYINRGHDVNCFKNCVNKLKDNNIFTVAHIINGLPYETKEDMIKTIRFLNEIKIDGIKIHALYISKNTQLAKKYELEKFKLLSKDEYIDIVCEQLTYLDEKIVIERITGDPVKEELIAPSWLLKKFVILNDIDKKMVQNNLYQGIKKNEN